MKHENESSKSQADSSEQYGSQEELTPEEKEQFPTLARMQELGIPLTRERYLLVEYGKPLRKTLGAEEEAMLPPRFQMPPEERNHSTRKAGETS